MSTEEFVLDYVNDLTIKTPTFILKAIFDECIANSYIRVLEKIIASKLIDPSMNDNYALRQAMNNSNYNIITVLLKDERVDQFIDGNQLFHKACNENKIDLVKLLLANEKFIPLNNANNTLYVVAINNNIEIMKLILADKRNFKDNDYIHAFNYVSSQGNIEMVKLLLTDGRFIPAANANGSIYSAIIAACDNNHTDIVKLLLPHVDLSKINHARIKKIAKKLESKPLTGWFDALNSIMNEYHIKSIFIEKGKVCNVVFDS